METPRKRTKPVNISAPRKRRRVHPYLEQRNIAYELILTDHGWREYRYHPRRVLVFNPFVTIEQQQQH